MFAHPAIRRSEPVYRRLPLKESLFCRLLKACPGAAVLTFVALLFGAGRVPAADTLGFVGSTQCGGCHADALAAWRGSHHDLAMQNATDSTVLGDFNNVTVRQGDAATRFFRREGGFFIETKDAEGRLAEFEVPFTFGVTPLQQYLVDVGDGALQTFGWAWDSRPKGGGGQRWMAVYGDEFISPSDERHWTHRGQTWNYMCADCHSTAFRKSYDEGARRYASVWAELDVGCEACHGPGAAHVAWAEQKDAPRPTAKGAEKLGLTHRLADFDGGRWIREPGDRIAHRSVARSSHAEINACARCHSRRTQINEAVFRGQELLDDYIPALLEPGLYHSDGQIDDEVYVWGSFLQSRMYQAGVTCSDCHDAHSGRLRAEGNTLCAGCHAAEAYDVPAHHHHAPGSAAAACVACHMPSRNYMQVDARRDHSMRVPRPDLSQMLGVPDVCSGCHADQGAAWAAAAIGRWRGGAAPPPHYGEILARGFLAEPGGEQALAALAADHTQPGIVRASAARLLGPYFPGQYALEATSRALAEQDPLIRLGALQALGDAKGIPGAVRAQLALPQTYDEVRAVRVTAARQLAGLPAGTLAPDRQAELEAHLQEFVASERYRADHYLGQFNLGNFFAERGDSAAAERAYREALALSGDSVPAAVNLAELLRRQGRDEEAGELLRDGVNRFPDNAELQHAIGLQSVRSGDQAGAVQSLERAMMLRPEEPRYAYVLGIALNSYGRAADAVEVFRNALVLHANDRDLLIGLASLYLEAGNAEAARGVLKRLLRLRPDDAQVRALEQALDGGGQ